MKLLLTNINEIKISLKNKWLLSNIKENNN